MADLILAIDPGTTKSAFVLFDPERLALEDKGIADNLKILAMLKAKGIGNRHLPLVIEMIKFLIELIKVQVKDFWNQENLKYF